MRVRCSLKLSLSFLFFCQIASASATTHVQQDGERDSLRRSDKGNACRNSERARFKVKCKARYFLGETPTVTISITNSSRSPQTVKVAEYQKFSFEMTGIFEDASQQETKTVIRSTRCSSGPLILTRILRT